MIDGLRGLRSLDPFSVLAQRGLPPLPGSDAGRLELQLNVGDDPAGAGKAIGGKPKIEEQQADNDDGDYRHVLRVDLEGADRSKAASGDQERPLEDVALGVCELATQALILVAWAYWVSRCHGASSSPCPQSRGGSKSQPARPTDAPPCPGRASASAAALPARAVRQSSGASRQPSRRGDRAQPAGAAASTPSRSRRTRPRASTRNAAHRPRPPARRRPTPAGHDND